MTQFFQELKRRNVIKAGVTYAVVSWAMLQVFSTIFPLLDVAPSALKTILYIMIAGFPVWLVLAYLFDWTPKGLQRTDDEPSGDSSVPPSGRKQNILIISGLSIAVLLLVAERIFESSLMADDRKKKSIAVLPFDNMSGSDDAYFSAGVTEDILTQISKISDLRVLSRFTLRDYETKGKNVQQIGEELGASYLLTGSIRKAGEQLRISCQLVQVDPEEQTWAETYDKRIADVFTIQATVAHEVAKNLRAKLTSDQSESIERPPTENLEAYNHFLLASSLYDNGNVDDNERAVTEFRKALSLDPKFLQALTGLIRAYNRSVTNYGVRPRAFHDSTFVLAEQAIAMDPEHYDALYTLSYQYLLKSQYTKAIELASKSVAINPNYSAAINGLGLLLRNTGRLDEAFDLFLKAKRLEPLKIHIFHFNLGTCCLALKKYPEALQFFESVIDVNKSQEIAYEQIGKTYGEMGEKQKVQESIDRLLKFQTNTKNLDRAAGLALYSGLAPNVIQRYADAVLRQKDFSYRDHNNSAIAKATLLLQQGKRDSALILLDNAFSALYAVYAERDDRGGIFLSYAEIEMLRGDRGKAEYWLRKMMQFENVSVYRQWEKIPFLQPLQDGEEYRDWRSRMEKRSGEMQRAISDILARQ